ncbi:MAG: hypothetical protein ACUVRT_15525 [Armatimonadota bacterium]
MSKVALPRYQTGLFEIFEVVMKLGQPFAHHSRLRDRNVIVGIAVQDVHSL